MTEREYCEEVARRWVGPAPGSLRQDVADLLMRERAGLIAERDEWRLAAGVEAEERRKAHEEVRRLTETLRDLRDFVWKGEAVARAYRFAATSGHRETPGETEAIHALHRRVRAVLCSDPTSSRPSGTPRDDKERP